MTQPKVHFVIMLFLCLVVGASAAPHLPPDAESTVVTAPISLREVLELGSFVATILVSVFALLALRQVTMAREQLRVASAALIVAQEDIRIRSEREAIALAAQRCEEFGSVTMELLNKLRDQFLATGIDLEPWKLKNKAFDDSSLEAPEDGKVWVKSVVEKNASIAACKMLNHLEGFAVYFATGAASEEIAFPVLGVIFCDKVQVLAPWLIAMRNHQAPGFTSGKYANTVKLYETWADRLRIEEIDELSKKVEAERCSLKSNPIKPIGVK